MVRITDSDGVILVDLLKKSEKSNMAITEKIHHYNHYVGSVTLGLTPRLYMEKDRGFLVASIILIGVLLLVLVITVTHILKSSLIRPIKYLMYVTEQIGAGNYDWVRAGYDQQEIKQIVSKFEDMAARISSREEDLKKINQELNREINERTKTEEALKENQRKFSIAFSSSPDAMLIIAMKELLVLEANDAFFRLSGLEKHNTIGRPVDLDRFGINPVITNRFFRLLRNEGRVENFEIDICARGRGLIPFLFSARLTDIGKTECIILVARDISRLKAVQEGLRKYERIVSTSRELMAYVDGRYIIRAVNESYLEAFLMSRQEVVGRPISDIVGADVFEAVIRDKMDQCLRGDEVQYEHWFDFPGLGRRYFAVSYYPYFDSSRAVKGLVINSRDVTATKELESNLIQAKKLEAIGTLATGVAHDFNNILQAISGNLQLFGQAEDNQKDCRKYINEIQLAANRATDLVQSLLSFGRKVEPGQKLIDVRTEILHSINMLKRTLPKMVDIKTEFAKNIHPVNADANQLNLLLMNLGANAGDAMTGGGELYIAADNVAIDQRFCANRPEARPGEYVRLIVRDTGYGMDPETMKRIFDPFYTTKGIGQGTGLGLFIVYGIVKNHGGFLACSSQVGQGTEFNIYLPGLPDQPLAQPISHEEHPRAHQGSERILLVDDDAAIIEIAREYLDEYGYMVDSAASGEEALLILNDPGPKYDLIVLDLGMPGMGGFKALEEILRVDDKMKVLVASGYNTESNSAKVIKAGAAGFLGKPYKLERLLEMIMEALRN